MASQGNFYARIAFAIVIIGIVLFWLSEKSQQPAPVSAVSTSSTSAPARSYAYTPTPQLPPPTPAVPRSSGVLAAAARQAGVTVASAQPQPDGWTIVTVRGNDRNALNDFMDQALRNGMRDMDVNRTQYRQYLDAQQRQVHEGTYRMRF